MHHSQACFFDIFGRGQPLQPHSILETILAGMSEASKDGLAGMESLGKGREITCSLRATSSSRALVRGDRLACLRPLEGLNLSPSSSRLKSLPCTPMVSNLHDAGRVGPLTCNTSHCSFSRREKPMRPCRCRQCLLMTSLTSWWNGLVTICVLLVSPHLHNQRLPSDTTHGQRP